MVVAKHQTNNGMNVKKKKHIPIKSVADYIDEVTVRCHIGENVEYETLNDFWFRGEPECYPNVLPSLFRGAKADGILPIAREDTLIDKAIQYYPALFEKCENALERLVTMRHYTLPTRLLDVTKNPLVALYMACENTYGIGRVLFTYKRPTNISTMEHLAKLISLKG